jgi:hypothetical protein
MASRDIEPSTGRSPKSISPPPARAIRAEIKAFVRAAKKEDLAAAGRGAKQLRDALAAFLRISS